MTLKAVGLISKPKKEDVCAVAPGVLAWLEKRGLRAVLDLESARCLDRRDGLPREQIPPQVDLLVVLGGDGTMLAAVRLVEHHPIPILGVNLGHLGFLTEITVEEMPEVLEDVLAGRHSTSQRAMLEAELDRSGQRIATHRALNDVVLHKAAIARMVELEFTIDSAFVSHIRGDGLIVATPTGSTAYSLSAGGPIVSPAADVMVVTPIAPHMLTNRPLVIPGSSQVEILLSASDERAYVTVDGQVGEEAHPGDRLRIRRAARGVELVISPRRDYFAVLRDKLRWGAR